MSMRAIRRSFIRGYRQQSKVTPELGARVLRLILAVCLGIDFAAGHPLWPTVVLIGAVIALFAFSVRAMRRPPPTRAPDEQDC
jgi:hypothetical protein